MAERTKKMINKIIMATNNKNKLRETRDILSPLGIEVISLSDAGIDVDPDETGETFEENATIKAQAVLELTDLPVIADDSGLCVEALGGRPGVHSARTYPEHEECAGLLEDMKDIPEGSRSAYFQCVIVYMDKNACIVFSGKCEGSIGFEQKGENGFGYDPVFMYEGRTLAEMSEDEKNSISHRGAALRDLYEYLKERNSEENADK